MARSRLMRDIRTMPHVGKGPPDGATTATSVATPLDQSQPAVVKIVVGYDGSSVAKRALDKAAALAGDGARVTVVAVVEPYPRSGVTIPANRDVDESHRRRTQLDEARALLADRGIQAETPQLRGKAADVLAEASRDADLLVVGSRRLNRVKGLLLGSVSSKLVPRAACDVLVVR